MRIGSRTRMGARTRGTCRLPSVIVEGDLTVEGDTTLAAVVSANLNTSNIVTADLQTDTMTADDVATFTGGVSCDSDLTMGSGFQVFIDPATSVANPPLAFRTDENNGLAYVSADSWRTVAGGANGYTFALGAGSQNGAIACGGVASIGTVLSLANDISPAALTGDVTDWSPTGISTASVVRVDPGAAARIINSMTAGTDGAIKILMNISTTQNVTLNHDDGTGTAAQRFLCPNGADHVIRPTGAAIVMYDATSSRWRVLAI